MNRYTFYEPETNQMQLSVETDKPLSEIYAECVMLLVSLGWGSAWSITTEEVRDANNTLRD